MPIDPPHPRGNRVFFHQADFTTGTMSHGRRTESPPAAITDRNLCTPAQIDAELLDPAVQCRPSHVIAHVPFDRTRKTQSIPSSPIDRKRACAGQWLLNITVFSFCSGHITRIEIPLGPGAREDPRFRRSPPPFRRSCHGSRTAP